MKKIIFRVLCLILVIIMIKGTVPSYEVSAAEYIKVSEFIKEIATQLKLPVNGTTNEAYVSAALEIGILKEEDYTIYNGYLTRADAAAFLNRADEYLHGKTVEDKLIYTMLEKRISDIMDVEKSKRVEVASIMAKGIMKGYSNGYYIQNRSFKGDLFITKAGALKGINLVLNPYKRAKISPDGMLIRTTDLPKNAEDYEYILACYPNEFYEKQFTYMVNNNWENGAGSPYYSPVEMKNIWFKNTIGRWNFTTEKIKYGDIWTAMAEKYLQLLFNVDYRTVGDEWIKELNNVLVNSKESNIDNINRSYIPAIKYNKVVIESKIIAAEPSTLYYANKGYCMRAYVKYRIKAASFPTDHNQLIYSRFAELENLKSGTWREGIFDIRFESTNVLTGDGSNLIIGEDTIFVDKYNK